MKKLSLNYIVYGLSSINNFLELKYLTELVFNFEYYTETVGSSAITHILNTAKNLRFLSLQSEHFTPLLMKTVFEHW